MDFSHVIAWPHQGRSIVHSLKAVVGLKRGVIVHTVAERLAAIKYEPNPTIRFREEREGTDHRQFDVTYLIIFLSDLCQYLLCRQLIEGDSRAC